MGSLIFAVSLTTKDSVPSPWKITRNKSIRPRQRHISQSWDLTKVCGCPYRRRTLLWPCAVQYHPFPHTSFVAQHRILPIENNRSHEYNDRPNYRDSSTPHSLLEWRILTPLMTRMMMVTRLLMLSLLLLGGSRN